MTSNRIPYTNTDCELLSAQKKGEFKGTAYVGHM